MPTTWKRYWIVGTKKKSGETISGTTEWDGLSSLYAVKQVDGSATKYLSVLDEITTFTCIEETA